MEAKQYSKRALFCVAILFYFCSSCANLEIKNPDKEIVFDWHDKKDSVIKSSAFTLQFFTQEAADSVVIIAQGDTIPSHFRQIITDSGIFRFCNSTKIKTHTFCDTLITEYCKEAPPFVNQNTSCRGSKDYKIGDKTYTLYHFVENTGNHTVYDSYFLKGIGFVCYYSFDRDEYIIASRMSGSIIDSNSLKEITNALIVDTTFFSKYYLKKEMPNYHRSSGSGGNLGQKF